MLKRIQKFLHKKERGQAIILIAFAMIALVAMVGLVTDTGILFIEYGKLKRGVDAASIAGAQNYRGITDPLTGITHLDTEAVENAAQNFLQLNQSNLTQIVVHSCEDAVVADRPAQCNPDPIGNPSANRKLVEVTASKQVRFGFLRVLGINTSTITTSSVGEAASIDLVLVVDTSGSMAYETGGDPFLPDSPLDDPSVCNLNNTCEPMREVKNVALDFIDTLYFPYDRVAIISMTSQDPNLGERSPMKVISLTSVKSTVEANIANLKVFQPRDCDGTLTLGSCSVYDTSTIPRTFLGTTCEIFYLVNDPNNTDEERALADPSSCPSSNVGGTLSLSSQTLTEAGVSRLDSFWVVVALVGGPANATDVEDPLNFPTGFCPRNTWLSYPWCRDRSTTSRHTRADTAWYDNPLDPNLSGTFSIFDADDFAMEKADELATRTTDGVTIYTIGLGQAISSTSTSDDGIAPGKALLKYIAEVAGGPDITHGQYFSAPTRNELISIFELIADNIATRISQ